MSAPKDVAAGFSISGLLDSSSKTRSRFPVAEIDVSEIADHPSNAAYSMEKSGIAALAESIKRDGLTDLPLVRKLPDGSWQMLSGHRRKAAYALLAEGDEGFRRMPCRIVEGIDDAKALVLLHTANYFVRELSVTERAAATRALGIEVERKRREDPALTGVRTEDIKADIIAEQTGRRVSGKTIKREEALARTIEEDLADEWKPAADSGEISAAAVNALAKVGREEQAEIASKVYLAGLSKRQRTEAIAAAIGAELSDCETASFRDVRCGTEIEAATADSPGKDADARLLRIANEAGSPSSGLTVDRSQLALVGLTEELCFVVESEEDGA
ncbi:chromosome partitioning protein ParB [Eggerthellaceae bacterium zg-887]|uniref:ParB/RepB/Spo0J family partition protein n=1 Tax=Xiamenia xianingshaonis TaxID=2682776 RepID=UPI001409A051|nr:ParB/RepB/Spo0J family partition protein [Xiamenia xianingshaonis]NHM15284.1 chromosome partitioning protein ParB [Xiamenia xianingshaonis]